MVHGTSLKIPLKLVQITHYAIPKRKKTVRVVFHFVPQVRSSASLATAPSAACFRAAPSIPHVRRSVSSATLSGRKSRNHS